MTVAELMEWLSQQHPDSPVELMGICECGEPICEYDIVLGTGQGPSEGIDVAVISWPERPDAVARYVKRYD